MHIYNRATQNVCIHRNPNGLIVMMSTTNIQLTVKNKASEALVYMYILIKLSMTNYRNLSPPKLIEFHSPIIHHLFHP